MYSHLHVALNVKNHPYVYKSKDYFNTEISLFVDVRTEARMNAYLLVKCMNESLQHFTHLHMNV